LFIGGSTLSGEFNGVLNINQAGGFNYLGDIKFNYSDVYEDPYDLFNNDIFGLAPPKFDPFGTPYPITDQWTEGGIKGSGFCR
jgi:hypothetical protein